MDDKESFDYIEANLDGRKEFSYKWKHIPTGKEGVNKLRLHSYEEFRHILERWNECNPGAEWQYTEA